MHLKEFLRDDFVLLSLESRDVEGVVGEMAARATEVGIGSEEVIGAKLLEREGVHPTVMGRGLAIPHATVPGLDRPVVGVALPGGDPIHFGWSDMDPVRLFFILLSPPGHEREHVKLLARICRLVRHDGFMERVEAATDPTRVTEIIRTVDALHV